MIPLRKSRRFRMPLPAKFILSISVLIVLTSLALGWSFSRNAVALIKAALMERGRSLARNLAYHRRARLETTIGRALEEVDRQREDLRTNRG